MLPLSDGFGSISLAMAADSSGNVYRVGRSFTVFKFSPTGSVLWDRNRFGDGVRGAALAVVVVDVGNVIVGGYVEDSFRDPEATLAKYDSEAEITWETTFREEGTSEFEHVALDPAGNVCALGRSGVAEEGSVDGNALVKFDADGKRLWAVQHEAKRSAGAAFTTTRLIVDGDGNVYMAEILNDEAMTTKFDPTEASSGASRVVCSRIWTPRATRTSTVPALRGTIPTATWLCPSTSCRGSSTTPATRTASTRRTSRSS